jgi:hypothetical protein
MIIDEHNYQLADDAIRDILFMYRDLVLSYRGFGHNVDRIRYNAFEYSHVEVRERQGETYDIDTELLMSGSAIAIICMISDIWDESDPSDLMPCAYFKRVEDQLNNGGFADFPDLQKVLRFGLKDEAAFRALLPQVYEDYVLGYFRELVRSG